MKTLFVINPRAGRNRRRPDLPQQIERFARAHGLDAHIALTTAPGHATDLARRAVQEGCVHVAAVGGDGTMNEIASALVGTTVALALVPCGSGNGLALHLSVPTVADRAWRLLADPSASVVAIDTAQANEHPFFNVAGIGFDAEISQRFNRLSRRGLTAYARTALVAFQSFSPERLRIETEQGTRICTPLMLTVANSDQFGNRAFIAPGASVTDGLLDLTAIPRRGWLGAGALGWRMFAGTLPQGAGVITHRASSFVVHRAAPGIIHTDGEVHHTGATVRFDVRPASLRVLVPRDSGVLRTARAHSPVALTR